MANQRFGQYDLELGRCAEGKASGRGFLHCTNNLGMGVA